MSEGYYAFFARVDGPPRLDFTLHRHDPEAGEAGWWVLFIDGYDAEGQKRSLTDASGGDLHEVLRAALPFTAEPLRWRDIDGDRLYAAEEVEALVARLEAEDARGAG